jgi:Zn-dependent protease
MESKIFEYILIVPPVLFAITIHEVAHGFIAYKRGDPTAYLMGRLNLNPLKHLDLFGSFIFPAMLIFFKAPFVFGWAKPVPVNFFALKNPKRDMIWVSAAGPGSNLLVAAVAGLLFRLGYLFYQGPETMLHPVLVILFYFVLIDTALAVFNLIPIPPLDGSKILAGLLPGPLSEKYLRLEKYGMFIFMALIIIIQLTRINFLSYVLALPVVIISRFLGGPELFLFMPR